MRSRKELGDFQTPLPLVQQVLNYLAASEPAKLWTRVLEPTCGVGNFVQGVLRHPGFRRHLEIRGIELQASHLSIAQENTCQLISNADIELVQRNIFEVNLATDIHWRQAGELLVLGNPPWVTNAELGSLSSQNLPEKRNLKGLSGLDALTGGSNFDIAEYIILKLIWELQSQQPTIAMLCKTSVARNVLQYAVKIGLPITEASIHGIDAKHWFDASVDACLLHLQVGTSSGDFQISLSVPMYADLQSGRAEAILELHGDHAIANRELYEQVRPIDGQSSMEWRQGVKHDLADVMELRLDDDDTFYNKLGKVVDVEADYIYPLLKGSDVYHQRISEDAKAVLLTQQHIGQDTLALEFAAPKLWAYLQRHKDRFDQRKSSIYQGRPPFSIFGIGDYTFAPHKVAVSGLHKSPRFIQLGLRDGKPIILDDTCYFLPCASSEQAALITTLLNHPLCQQFLSAVSFSDAKRPITKKILQRIDLRQLAILTGVDTSLLPDANATLAATSVQLPLFNPFHTK